VGERLYRSSTDRVIAGVAGGLAAWLKIDPSIVRVAWVVLAVLSGGIFLLVYFVMMIVVPLAPPGWAPTAGPASASGQPPPPGGPSGAWTPPPSQWGSQQPGVAWTPPPTGGPGWKSPDPGNAGIVFGFILVGLGVWFLLDQYVHIDWQLVWPVIVIVIGVALIAGAMRRNRPSA
jgi:phage shock protein C